MADFWTVTYGKAFIMPGEGKSLTRGQRIRRRVLRPWYRLRYGVEDAWDITYWRVRNAWSVLIGRDHIL